MTWHEALEVAWRVAVFLWLWHLQQRVAKMERPR